MLFFLRRTKFKKNAFAYGKTITEIIVKQTYKHKDTFETMVNTQSAINE